MKQGMRNEMPENILKNSKYEMKIANFSTFCLIKLFVHIFCGTVHSVRIFFLHTNFMLPLLTAQIVYTEKCMCICFFGINLYFVK